MTLLKKVITSAALVALLTVPASAAASTNEGEKTESTSGSGSTTTIRAEDGVKSSTSGSGTSTSGGTSTAEDTVKTEFRNRAKQQVEDLRKKGQQKTKAARETACNEHKNGAQQRITSISTNTARFQAKLDSVFAKTQTYVTDKNLTVENYDALVTAVKSAQAASAQSVFTLQGMKPTIDCTKDTNAENVTAFRTASQDARDKLKAYMKSLKELLKAVRDAKQATQTQTKTETETEGSTN